jgi:hypothetical protein
MPINTRHPIPSSFQNINLSGKPANRFMHLERILVYIGLLALELLTESAVGVYIVALQYLAQPAAFVLFCLRFIKDGRPRDRHEEAAEWRREGADHG